MLTQTTSHAAHSRAVASPALLFSCSEQVGKVSAAISAAKPPKTPLQKKLRQLGIWLVIISVALCVLVAIIGVARGHPWMEMITVSVRFERRACRSDC